MGDKPSDRPDEYAAREELAKRRQAHADRVAELAEQERADRKQLHWMCCPKCGSQLEEIQFRGVKVDKCFGCGGVYLDDGELEQLAGKPGWLDAMRSFFRGGG